MFKILIQFIFISLVIVNGLSAQTKEELTAQRDDLQSQVAALQAQVTALNARIAAEFPEYGWTTNFLGTIGVNLSSFSNWVTVALPESSNTTILGSFNSIANLNQKKYFWRNSLSVNLGWQRLIKDKNNSTEEENKFSQTADIFNINSLYGYRLSDKLAVSTLGEYRTNLLNNFNNPGFLDLGVGVTWTPISNLVVVMHPINYNFIFSNEGTDFVSSLGSKVVADYVESIAGKINWRSNLSGFLSYKDITEFSNFTWTNGFSFTAFKGIGVGLEYALRWNRQETLAFGSDSHMQQYFIVGLSYKL